MNTNFMEYKTAFLQELQLYAEIQNTDTEDAFLQKALSILSENDEMIDAQIVNMGNKKGKNGRIMHIDGYAIDETEKALSLFISDFEENTEIGFLTQTKIEELQNKMYFFLDEVCNGDIEEYFDVSNEIYKISRKIKRNMTTSPNNENEFLKVKFFILTNRELSNKLSNEKLAQNKKIKSNFNNKPLEINIWHLERFFEAEFLFNEISPSINLATGFASSNGLGIKTLQCDLSGVDEYESYIAYISGKLLADIYIEYGSKVLEGNVRAFLGTSGSKSVNNGMKKTINNEPEKFFAYNNGISVTASNISTKIVDGQLYITDIDDFQIINGGQTTATLAECVLKKTANSELKNIYVTLKLTIIKNRDVETEEGISNYDDAVKNIARYANSQNKVTAADLLSNDAYHVRMEQLSKQTLVNKKGEIIATGWYYERARKKYAQEQVKLKGIEKNKFIKKYPKEQVITKEQIAMYDMAINEKPHIVSKGKNWAMKYYSEKTNKMYEQNRNDVNDVYFKKQVVAAIIYRTTDNYLEKNKSTAKRPTDFWYKSGGYKLNIVPYTIAKLMSLIPNGFTIDYEKIWNDQAISDAFMNEIKLLLPKTNDFICDSNGVIVTEYCKKEETWEKYKKLNNHKLSQSFLNELIPICELKNIEKSAKKEERITNDLERQIEIVSIGADTWNRILEKGKERNLLNQLEISLLQTASKSAMSGNVIKDKTKINLIFSVKDKLETEGIV